MRRAIAIAVILSAFCLSAEAQTVKVTVLNEAGAQIVLKAAEESAQQKSAPSAIAVVDPAGDLLAFQRMDCVRPDRVDLAIQKARTAGRLRRATARTAAHITHARTAIGARGLSAPPVCIAV